MIEIEIPGVEVIQFPDGTPQEVIDRVVGQKVGSATPQQQPNSWWQMPARGITQAIGGLGDTLNMINPLYHAYNTVQGSQLGQKLNLPATGSLREGLPELANLPQPQNDNERRIAAVAEGLASYAPFFGAGTALQGVRAGGQLASRALPAIGRALTTAPVVQGAASGLSNLAASDIAAGGGSPVDQLLGAAGVDLAVGGVPATARGIRNLFGGLVNQNKLNAFRRAGVNAPSLGAVSDNSVVQQLEAGLSQDILAGGILSRARQQGNNILANEIDRAANNLGLGQYVPQSREQLGESLQQAARAGANRFSNWAADFENNIYAPMGSNPAPIDNLLSVIQNNANKLTDNARTEYLRRMRRTLGGLVTDVQNSGATNVDTLRQFSRRTGEQLNTPPTANTGNASQYELRELYNAARDDILDAIPEPQRSQVTGYNAQYSAGKALRDDVERTFFGSKSNPQITNAALRADANQLGQLREAVGDNAFNQLRAFALRDYATGLSGFSAAQAAKRLGEDGRYAISQPVRQLLFGGADKNIADIANALQQARLYTNTSNTAGANRVMQFLSNPTIASGGLAALTLNPVAILSGVALPSSVAGALTSPNIINALGRIRPRQSRWPALQSILGQELLRNLPGMGNQ